MCTLTWTRRPNGYALLMNRDERLTRLPALPPREGGEGVRWIAPADGDFGGTWIAANERGVTIGLLNGPAGKAPPADILRSRGLLVRDLAGVESVESLLQSLGTLDLSPYRAFRMFGISADEPLVLAEWDGAALTIDRTAESRRPIVSSALRETEVEKRRRETYARLVGEEASPPIERLEEYHRSHLPERGTMSVCMHRDDAATRSLTRVIVCAEEVTMIDHAGSPCTPSPVSHAALVRAVARPEDIR